MNFEELKNRNIKKIIELKRDIKTNPNNENLKTQLQINEKINSLLQEGEGIFFKIKMEDSLKILEQILDKDEVEKAYLQFISPETYKRLIDKFQI